MTHGWHWISPLSRGLRDVVWPSWCESCRRPLPGGDLLCSVCRTQIQFAPNGGVLFCLRCGAPSSKPGLHTTQASRDERDCCRTLLPHSLRYGVVYDRFVSGLIVRYKSSRSIHLASLFAQWALFAGRELLAESEVIVPAPPVAGRLVRYGYCPVFILARMIAQQAKLPLALLTLERRLSWRSPSGLGRQERLRFAYLNHRHTVDVEEVRGRRVLVFDDVLTTGATVNALTAELYSVGASRVQALTVARVMSRKGVFSESEPRTSV